MIGIGWDGLGDMTRHGPLEQLDRARLYELFSAPPSSRANRKIVEQEVAQVLRFVRECRIGDAVVFLPVGHRTVEVGEIASYYYFERAGAPTYPHRRRVNWRYSVDLADLAGPAQRAVLYCGRSFWQMQHNYEEIVRRLMTEPIPSASPDGSVSG
jgi:predicted Mrr-cat superfamily restriction endonuclease